MSSTGPALIRSTETPAITPEEWALRVQLAACYRLVARFRMTDLIFTHISARLPGPEHRFLLNPYGLMFEEITASNLVVVDLEGQMLSANGHSVNPAGFVIHSAIHGAREDAQCVLHTHTRAGVAVSTLRCGLLPLNQFALQFYNRIAYHDYEGIALDLDERARLVADLGDKQVMILRNHGLLTVGRSIPEAFVLMFYLERSCEVQIAAQSTGTELILPSPEVCARTERQYNSSGVDDPGDEEGWALTWSALLRMLDREDPSYKE
ncbi:class II aldolase/adducin family protein [Rhodospirillaceae bacterium SYSU D60014]|uniref:class II aldolase/adducin family protein n=1 Tax=Virgifigura deserti TaxID=2268457 RepID=UPI000E664C4E